MTPIISNNVICFSFNESIISTSKKFLIFRWKDGSTKVEAKGSIKPKPNISTTAFNKINRNRKEIPIFCL